MMALNAVGEVAERTRVLLVHDENPDGERVAALLAGREDCCPPVCVQSPTDAFLYLSEKPIDVALVAGTLGDQDGIELVKVIRAEYPMVAVLVLSEPSGPADADRAYRAGAQGHVSSLAQPGELVRAVVQVAQGGTWFNGHPNEDEGNGWALTDTERAVYELIGRCHGATEIESRLSVSNVIVEQCCERIKAKLGLDSTQALVRSAMEWVHQQDVQARSGRRA